MRRRTERRLSEAELQLWTQVARSVSPMPGRTVPDAPLAPPTATLVPAPGSFAVALVQPAIVVPPSKMIAKTLAKPAMKPLAPIERRVLTALKRGARAIEAVIDLHGLYQEEAHAALRLFLVRAQANGLSLVLVITGKGAASTNKSAASISKDAAGMHAGGDERGVLRRMVPHWLRMADMRSCVLGFDEAAHQHGGTGALYVRIRRHRDIPS
jgi:DNA-nicking Smr family endonuclease